MPLLCDMVGDVEHAECCAACGVCCRLFTPVEEIADAPEGAWGDCVFTEDIAEMAESWNERFRECGAYRYLVPAWDVRKAQDRDRQGALLPAAEHYRTTLPAGTDFGICPYLGGSGCRLPRTHRPPVCRSFECDRLWDSRNPRVTA